MQVFILGKTKTGKSTLAKIVKEFNYTIYEAGSWAREEFSTINTGSTDEFSQEFKENLTQYALSKLKEDSYYSVKKYEKFIKENEGKKLIVGVRNPDDFLQMLRKADKNLVIFIQSQKQFEGSLELFEEGLKIIHDYLDWKKRLGNPIDVVEISEEDIHDEGFVIQLLKGKL